MPIVDISATLDGGSTLGAATTATYAASSTQPGGSTLLGEATSGPPVNFDGESTLTAEAPAIYGGTVAAAGEAGQIVEATANYAGTTALAGDSSMTAVPALVLGGSAGLAGESTLTSIVRVEATAALTGESSMAALNLAVNADLVGDASVTAGPSMGLAAAVELFGEAGLETIVGVEATATLSGASSMTALNLAVTADLAGGSSMAAVAGLRREVTAGLAGSSTLIPSFRVEATAALTGSSGLAAQAAVVGLGNTVLASGLATVAAAGTVKAGALAAIGGGSTLGGFPNYGTLQAKASIVASSELTADATFVGAYGVDSYGGSPYGSSLQSYGIEAATVLSSTQVRIRYTAMFDPEFPLLLSAANYSITPPLVINFIVIESAQSVVLHTAPLGAIPYTVTIAAARGYLGQPLDPALNSAEFVGVLAEPSFYAVATGPNRVRAVFSEPMLPDSLDDALQYALWDASGTDQIPIDSVTIEQADPNPALSTALQLGEDLVHARHYRLTVLSGIVSLQNAPVTPDTDSFQYVGSVLQAQIPVSEFSGEVLYGLYGIHQGLVFFSPALENSAANSIIEVDQVDVCTRAYDEYHPPQPLDPRPIFTHGLNLLPTPAVSIINSADWVLWAAFPRLVEARFDLGMGTHEIPLEDSVPPPTDDAWTSLTLTNLWPPGRVSLLNSPHWELAEQDGGAASITAAAAGLVTIDGLTGRSYLDVGKILTIWDAATASNNGNFLIVAYISPTSVQIENPAGAPDANNGALTWAVPAYFIVADNLTPFPPPGPSTTTVLDLVIAAEATLESEALV